MRPLLDLLFPPLCLQCEDWSRTEDPLLCPAHWQTLRQDLRPDDRHSLFSYRGLVRDLILKWKLGSRPSTVHLFAGLLAEKVQRRMGSYSFDGITFVPLHRSKRKRRGFDQAEALAREMARILGMVFHRTLIRLRDTRPQGDPGTRDRVLNVAGAFGPEVGARIQGKAWILVDDVVTSGSTLTESLRTLRLAGARKVWVATLARAGLQ